MANSVQILNKIARAAEISGLTLVSQTSTAVVVDNSSNDLTISYTAADIDAPMGGVSSAAAPYLGMGIVNPGTIKIKSASTAADAVTDVIDSVIAAKVFRIVCGFANDVHLENSDATFSLVLPGNVDFVGLGQ